MLPPIFGAPRPQFTLKLPFAHVRSRHEREPRSGVRHQLIAFLVVWPSQASLNFEEPALQALIASLPEAPAAARLRCLEMCGLDTGDDAGDDTGDDNLSFSFDFDS